MLIGVCYAWRPVAGVAWQIPSPWNWALVPVQLVAVWLTLRATAVIDGLELAGVRQVWVWHPIYLGWILLVFAVGTMTMTRLVFAVVSSVYILVAIPFEERTLRAHSGGGYEDYIRRVRWKLIPRVY